MGRARNNALPAPHGALPRQSCEFDFALVSPHVTTSRQRYSSPQTNATRYVRTSILPPSAFSHVEQAGVSFASAEDGGRLLVRILSDSGINGRQLFLAPRKWAEEGVLDFGIDDYEGDALLEEVQEAQLRGAPVEEGLFLEGRW